MQIDFHFSVIYGLCRCWGFDPQESQIIATASQFTDDCVVFRELHLLNGTTYAPIETQCQPQRNLGKQAQAQILRPFHFLQEGGKDDVVKAGNQLAKDLLQAALDQCSQGTPNAFHVFGIALHVYADTYSHQGFSPYLSDVNTVLNLASSDGDESLLQRIMGTFFRRYPGMLPRIGHAEAFTCPDLPFLKWYYENDGMVEWIGKEENGVSAKEGQICRDNPSIAAAAAAQLSDIVFNAKLRKPNRDIDAIRGFFNKEAFVDITELDGRELKWRNRILAASNPGECFTFMTKEDKDTFEYLGDIWPGKAYRLFMEQGQTHYGLVPGYTKTDWWKFQQAARWVAEQAEA